MLVTYFDEVKYQKGRSPYYWLGAIVADATTIWTLEGAVNDLAQEVFGHKLLTKSSEFHAADLMNGHEHFKGWPLDKRLDVLKRLITIFGSTPDLLKVYVRMNVDKMLSSDHEKMAFMFLAERVNDLLTVKNMPGILIGDRENNTVSGTFAVQLSMFRTQGTKYDFGKQLTHLLDTVHFTDSHHSRMLQLADLHVWLRQLAAREKPSWHAKQIISHAYASGDCMQLSKYKDWPTDQSWLKK